MKREMLLALWIPLGRNADQEMEKTEREEDRDDRSQLRGSTITLRLLPYEQVLQWLQWGKLQSHGWIIYEFPLFPLNAWDLSLSHLLSLPRFVNKNGVRRIKHLWDTKWTVHSITLPFTDYVNGMCFRLSRIVDQVLRIVGWACK